MLPSMHKALSNNKTLRECKNVNQIFLVFRAGIYMLVTKLKLFPNIKLSWRNSSHFQIYNLSLFSQSNCHILSCGKTFNAGGNFQSMWERFLQFWWELGLICKELFPILSFTRNFACTFVHSKNIYPLVQGEKTIFMVDYTKNVCISWLVRQVSDWH